MPRGRGGILLSLLQNLRHHDDDINLPLQDPRCDGSDVHRIAVLDVGRDLLVLGEGVEHRAVDPVETDAREEAIECFGANSACHERLYRLVLDECELHHAGEIWTTCANARCGGTMMQSAGGR